MLVRNDQKSNHNEGGQVYFTGDKGGLTKPRILCETPIGAI